VMVSELVLGRMMRKVTRVSVKVENDLDQDVTVQIYANHEKSTAKATTLGASFTVATGGIEVKTLEVSTSGWLPFLYLTAQCAIAPTSGSLTARLVRDAESINLFFDALEIRDTIAHESSILEW